MTYGALVAAAAGAFLLYAASPHQQLFERRPSGRALAATGVVGILLALVLALQEFGRATAVYYTMTILMLVWTLLPLLVVCLGNTREPLARDHTDA
jgi:hypothetical protein